MFIINKTIGIYAITLHTLNKIDSNLLLIAKEDKLGRQIQDIKPLSKKGLIMIDHVLAIQYGLCLNNK